ncbi:hypothetical protein [Agromyces sp. CCNWLW203]|uniref:hypothetical protein n=1 Tax=Agromyces sp. CCNWLW203 TaxID=3112842 RepID=UPI002F9643F8
MIPAAASAALLVVALAGCAPDMAVTGGAVDAAAGAATDPNAPAGVPEVCLDTFATALAAASLDDLALLPPDWPEPVTGSTLCVTSETVGGSRESAEYATDADAAAVLAHFEQALPAEYAAVRTEGAFGDEVLTGTAGDVVFEIGTGDGRFSIDLLAE